MSDATETEPETISYNRSKAETNKSASKSKGGNQNDEQLADIAETSH